MNDDNGYNAGDAGAESFDTPDSGSQDVDAAQPSDTPDSQNGQQTDPRDAELERIRKENRALNQRLVEARRNGNQPQRQDNTGDKSFDLNDPANQYAFSMKAATGDLRSGLEDVLSLYPELPQSTVNLIRKNPWAFAKQENYMYLNVENALLDIEEYMANEAERIEKENGKKADTAQTPTNPASVNANSAPESEPEGELSDWDVPLEELEKRKEKAKALLTKSKS